MLLLNKRLPALSDGRKFFTTGLSNLLEKTVELKVQKSILAVMQDWLIGDNQKVGSVLTAKEKTVLALKFLS
jgi:hypothetical protein